MKQAEHELTRVKFKAFGKIKFKASNTCDKKLTELQRKKIALNQNASDVESEESKAIDEEIAAILVKKQSEGLQKEVGYLLDAKRKGGTSAALFKLKNKVLGPKSPPNDAVIIVDPTDGCEIDTAHGIRKVTLEYCTNLLTNREPVPDFIEEISTKQSIHSERMIATHSKDEYDNFSEVWFNSTYERLSKKPGNKFQFIFKAGNSLKPALSNICKIAWETESLPREWSQSTLIQLYKGSGPANHLKNHRFIYMKSEFAKFFGNIVMDQAKGKLFENMSNSK